MKKNEDATRTDGHSILVIAHHSYSDFLHFDDDYIIMRDDDYILNLLDHIS